MPFPINYSYNIGIIFLEKTMLATRTDTVRARIAPELKNSVERIFSSLGMNSSQAIVLFFKQVELHNGLPFEVKIPQNPPLNMATMTDEEIDAALQVGFDDIEKAHADFRRRHAKWSNTPSR